jgi:hypothetical protein
LLTRDRRGFEGKADITERKRVFTSFEDRKTEATSGSRTTATDPARMLRAKRFDRESR